MFCVLYGIDLLTEVLRNEINDRSGAFAAVCALELELEPKSAGNKRKKERQMKVKPKESWPRKILDDNV